MLLCLSVISCSKNLKFTNSEAVPAARGNVNIDKDDNGNYALDIDILHLTEPSRLHPSKNVYVIWMETENNGIKNLGQLKSSTGFFSNTLKASFHTVTSFKPKRVFITAENDANIQTPGPQVVLTTKSR
ncbi:hypothetical protein [Mucilaginibacter sp.]|uniref:hypothetical protein n=1 Tax=Mucilaginibacter sp. TaxID=1882438 RepID=UPI003AFFB59C